MEACRRSALGIIGACFAIAILSIPLQASDIYSVPIELSPEGLIFTRVQVNGEEVVALIDSGSFRAVQLSSTLAQGFGILLTETRETSRRYDGTPVPVRAGRVNTLAIGSFTQRGVPVEVIEGDIERISQQVHTPFTVILGWPFLSRFRILLDYRNRRWDFSTGPLELGQGKLAFPYSVIHQAPIVTGRVGKDSVCFLIDTGAPRSRIHADFVRAPQGTIIRRELVIAERVLTFEFSVSDLSVIKQTLGCVGVIGNDFLREYRVYVDPVQQVVTLY